MSPEELEPKSFLQVQPIRLYRIAKAKYANLSGIGAAISPGRWNSAGEEAIYASTNSAVPQLEKLVHTPKNLIPSNLVTMKIHLSGAWRLADEIQNPDIGSHAYHAQFAQGFISHEAGTPSVPICYSEETRDLIFACPNVPIAQDFFQTQLPIIRGYVSILAVAVPSVVHKDAWNFVLFPAAKDFWKHVSLAAIEPFEFDPRLFPENTPSETP